jgi:hypothetical protein
LSTAILHPSLLRR